MITLKASLVLRSFGRAHLKKARSRVNTLIYTRPDYSCTPRASLKRGSAHSHSPSLEASLFCSSWRVVYGRRMFPGPAEPSGFWGPLKYTPRGLRAPHWLRRFQRQQSARDRMSSSYEETRSRGGGSSRDLKMASSSSSSLEGGLPPPPHQNRIRQVCDFFHFNIASIGPVSRETTPQLRMPRNETVRGVADFTPQKVGKGREICALENLRVFWQKTSNDLQGSSCASFWPSMSVNTTSALQPFMWGFHEQLSVKSHW